VTDCSGSYVHGSVIDGVFAGFVECDGKRYNIDRAEVHFNETQPFHSIIYSDEDLIDNSTSRFVTIEIEQRVCLMPFQYCRLMAGISRPPLLRRLM